MKNNVSEANRTAQQEANILRARTDAMYAEAITMEQHSEQNATHWRAIKARGRAFSERVASLACPR